jgi:hypothetical protein
MNQSSLRRLCKSQCTLVPLPDIRTYPNKYEKIGINPNEYCGYCLENVVTKALSRRWGNRYKLSNVVGTFYRFGLIDDDVDDIEL